ncbi:MAG: NAD-dependent succinate-semialdehyde dehydrogenase [Acidobacteria bacterium]|nr:NAD-dependent succinate-semialdehyde dehydrogenase [Acidobacteriota bacterium]
MTSTYRSLNPTTEKLVKEFPCHSDPQLEATLARAHQAFLTWRHERLGTRTQALLAIAQDLESHAEDLAALMASEMGKPLSEGIAEAKKCAWVCRFYAEQAADFLATEPLESDGSAAYARKDPLGTILAIMPWNFPFWQVFRCAAPALAAGNTVILKHAPNTPQCALAIENLGKRHLPKGVFQNLFLSNQQASLLIADPRIRGVSLTGSTRAGQEIGAQAGRALKPMVLELGGSDPFIVFDDADMEQAVKIGTFSRCLNSGQSCIAAKRFLVAASAYAEFTERLTQAMTELTIGDPLEGCNMGPLARADLRDQLVHQVDEAQKHGALIQGQTQHVPEVGYFHPAIVLSGHSHLSVPAQQEFFGPVAQVFSFTDEQNAVELANCTSFGLGASVWTRDLSRIEWLAPRLDSGSIFVNGLVKSDPRLPFGGTKQSGFGRELAAEGLFEFINLKTVWIA